MLAFPSHKVTMLAHPDMLDPVQSSKIPLEVLGSGSLMLVIITLIHGAGLDWIVGRFDRRSEKLRERRRSPHLASLIFSYAILLMLFLHISELVIWGVVLNVSGLIPNLRDSVYFSANTYTTIGYGKMILPDNWRELSPIMAIWGSLPLPGPRARCLNWWAPGVRLPKTLQCCARNRSRPRTANRDPGDGDREISQEEL